MVNFKMTKKVKNIMFLILLCCFFGGIGLFNYSVDPYNVFHNKDYMNLHGGFGSVFIKMKAYKNIPYSTVIIGGSEVSSMFPCCEFTKKYFNRIAMDDGLPHKFFGSLLKPYIDLHPETEKVIIFINYMSIIYYPEAEIPVYSGKSFNKEEIIKIFFGIDTTKKSIVKIWDKVSTLFYGEEIYEIHQVPKLTDTIDFSEAELAETLADNIKYIDDILNFLDEKNIKYEIVIPPYNGAFLAFINENDKYRKSFETFKIFLTDRVGEIYDFAFINKYTSENMLDKHSYLYNNYNHPDHIFGAKVFKVLYDLEIADPNIFVKLTKNNINQELIHQRLLVKEYIKNNKETYDQYSKWFNQSLPQEEAEEQKLVKFDDIPNDGKLELEYIYSKMEY